MSRHLSRHLALALAVTLLAGCAASQPRYREEVVDRVTESSHSRPSWVLNPPQKEGRITLVTTSTEGLSVEVGTRLAKAYALAQLSEQALASVQTNSKVSTKGGGISIQDQVSWASQGAFRSLRQDEVYWEKRQTQEGQRYSVWVLWSIPEKAFYEAQQEAIAQDSDLRGSER